MRLPHALLTCPSYLPYPTYRQLPSQVRRRILTELAPQIQQLLPEAPSGWAYDGDKILYTVGRLSSGPIELRRSEAGAEEGRGSGGDVGRGRGAYSRTLSV